MNLRILLTFAVLGYVSAFLLRSANRLRALSLASTPSDVDESVEAEIVEGTKLKLMKGCKSSTRMEINEFVLELEKTNPTPEPAKSYLLNGVWELVVSGLSSPGLIGYQVAKSIPGGLVQLSNLTVTISRVNPRVIGSTTLKIGGLEQQLSVESRLETLSDMRLKEVLESAKIGAFEIPLNALSGITDRELLVTYVDEELLIVRDAIGSPEVLRRREGEMLTTGAPGI